MNQSISDYKNANLPIDIRVHDLLNRMTLDEKVRQMNMYAGSLFVDKMSSISRTSVAPDGKLVMSNVKNIIDKRGIGCIHDLYPSDATIPNEIQKYCMNNTRLGIPVLFSEEALHGLGALESTIFPQAIAMASTWNPELIKGVGAAIAREARSRGIHLAFSPVLDIARDPRWGRVEETYGEDPYLTSRIGVAMVEGMQGEKLNTDYSMVAEPKHFGAHAASQGGLNMYGVSLGERELRQSHLSTFKDAVMEGGAMSIMCAYHSNDGVPCASDKWLLTDVLRGEWGFKGFVCSDLGAIKRLYTMHHTAASQEDAVKQALVAGVDMQFFDFDNEWFQTTVMNMVNNRELGIDIIDRAAGSILRVKYMLGLFENPYIDTQLAKKVNRSQENQDLALQVAREAICLLKNKENILPLDKKIKSIAVIGPNADIACMGDYTPPVLGFDTISVLDGIRSMVSPQTEVTYVKGAEVISGDLTTVPSYCLFTPDGKHNGLKAEYYNSSYCQEQPALTRIDPEIDFNWIMSHPTDKVVNDEFFVRWTGKLLLEKTQIGRMGTVCLDNIRLWLDDELVVDQWDSVSSPFQDRYIEFQQGKYYDIKIEYQKKKGGGSEVKLGWNFDQASIEEAVEVAKGKDVAIVVVGDSRQTSGEGKDRSSLDLPGKQKQLVQEVYNTGTPVILVLLNGRPMTVQWEEKHVDGIIEAWYLGEKGGQAIAEVLFGDHNPAGRLPMTIPKYVGQLPIYYNMLMFGQKHYIDMDSLPLFTFGFGLSYTEFIYKNLTITPSKVPTDGTVEIGVDVVNIGTRNGDEVVQMYINDVISTIATPDKQLKRFKRIYLHSGERQSIRFTLDIKELAYLDGNMKQVVEPGNFEIMVGGSSESLIKDTLCVKY